MHCSRRSSSSEGSSPPSNPRRHRHSHSRSSARSPMSYVDLNCLQDSAQFPEDAPPSSPPPDYEAMDLHMWDSEFHRRTLGATSGRPPPPAQHTSTSGQTPCLALLAQCSLLISIFPLLAVCAAQGVPGYGTMLIPPARSVRQGSGRPFLYFSLCCVVSTPHSRQGYLSGRWVSEDCPPLWCLA